MELQHNRTTNGRNTKKMQTQMDAMDHNRTRIHPKPHTNKIHQPTKLQRIQKPKTKNTKQKKHTNKNHNITYNNNNKKKIYLQLKKKLTNIETQLIFWLLVVS